jgi:glycosyltransferase involved in cell wall biosynthesis
VPDVVGHEQTGLLVPPSDPEALAHAMVKMSRSPAERQRWGEAGRKASARYRSEVLVTSLVDLYAAGLHEKRG